MGAGECTPGERLGGSLPPGARRRVLYRLTVWWLRLLPIALVPAMVFLAVGGWIVVLCYVAVGLLITLPMRLAAYTEWGLRQSDLDEMVLRDAVNVRFW
ncbi:hypothetical protein [Micromonospora gifhornensis]|uniref:hypothetical protein n=1 Tax=Micromonospora gifhornensis TaxID=84594 RepID=UPI00364C86B2